MKVLLQRVTTASVRIASLEIARIEYGLLLLTGFGLGDEIDRLEPMAAKLINMRIFSDERGKMNRSLREIDGDVLIVPQFTLYADTSRGRRPEFSRAMAPHQAREMFAHFTECFRETGIRNVQCGKFGEHMSVCLENDGPVTIMLDE